METRRALDLSVQEVIYAGLEALQAVAQLDVCAYLDRSDSAATQLFLGAPSLAAAGGDRAYEIFSVLRDTLERPRLSPGAAAANGRSEAVVELLGMSAVVVVTAGAVSSGVCAVGRKRPLDRREHAALVRLARALGTAVHRLQAAIELDPRH